MTPKQPELIGEEHLIASRPVNMGIDAGTIIDGDETVPQVGQRIFEEMLRVTNGKMTKKRKVLAKTILGSGVLAIEASILLILKKLIRWFICHRISLCLVIFMH